MGYSYSGVVEGLKEFYSSMRFKIYLLSIYRKCLYYTCPLSTTSGGLHKRLLHEEITGQNYSYADILEIAIDIFGK